MRRSAFLIAFLVVAITARSYSAQDPCFDTASYATRTGAHSVVAKDLDGDAVPDLATGIYWGGYVQVLKGAGDGSFTILSEDTLNGAPQSIISADLDKDLDEDLVVAAFGNLVVVLTNHGDGTFDTASYAAGAETHSVTSADFDLDGDLDLAVANRGDSYASVLMNNGDATFSTASSYTVGSCSQSILAANLNGDSYPDLIIAKGSYGYGSNNISILLNAGDGTFHPQVDYLAGDNPWSVAATDFDGDGDTDLAVANAFSDNVSVLMNVGDGTFSGLVNYPTGGQPHSIVTGDFDRDGDQDLATANYTSDGVSILRNLGTGAFSSPYDYVAGDAPHAIFAANLDGDWDVDLVVANDASSFVSVLVNCLIETPPVAICQNVLVNANESCQAAVAPSAVNNGSWDEEDSTNLTLALVPDGPFPVGVTQVLLIVTDRLGAADTCSSQISVVDYTAPAVTCPNDTVVANTLGQCGRVIDFTASATDNCPEVALSYSPPSGSFFPIGGSAVMCIATDAVGNADTCTFIATVNDPEAPVVDCPATITNANDTGQCGAIVMFSVGATDNCSGVTVSTTPSSGSLFPVGTTVVTAIATDTSGNKDTCSFQVTVTDDEKPDLVCPASSYDVVLPPGQICGVVEYSTTVSDNCPGVVSVLEPPSGSTFCVGTTTVGCVAGDVSGNQDTCFFDVIVTASCWCPRQGDINSDTVIDVFDVIGVIGIAFSGDPDPRDEWCPKTRGDVDNNGVTDVFDVIYLIATAFSGGPNPVDPCL